MIDVSVDAGTVPAGTATESPVSRFGNSVRRTLLLVGGGLSLTLGLIGIVVPLWPTTCFLLLSAWCFARSSEPMHRWLRENPLFGDYLTLYCDHRVIPRRVRATSITALWVTLVAGVILAQPPFWVSAMLGIIGLAVSVHLLSLDTAL